MLQISTNACAVLWVPLQSFFQAINIICLKLIYEKSFTNIYKWLCSTLGAVAKPFTIYKHGSSPEGDFEPELHCHSPSSQSIGL